MDEQRKALIYTAIMDKLGLNIAVFTSDDILLAAGITSERADQLASQVKDSLHAIVSQCELVNSDDV